MASSGHVVATTKVGLEAVGVVTALLAPLLGFWLSSSLAAYRNGSVLLSLLLGLLLFPVAPVTWELIAQWRRRQRATVRPPILTTVDRLILRTLAVNVLFVTLVLAISPRAAFRAIATRGDWALEGHDGATANRVRGWLFGVADGLESLYTRAGGNPYGKSDAPPTTPTFVTDGHWPQVAERSDSIDTVPADLEHDFGAVARYLVSVEPDDFARVKALHDFVGDRLTYDHAAARREIARPPQDAESVFAAGTAVCEGYARLLSAMADAAGLEIDYVVGVVHGRAWEWDVDGSGHAWNAAHIEGAWYLLDPTWDDTDDAYGTDYLFTPPEAFSVTHLPDDARWQLREEPISLSDFMRQAITRPSFSAHGLTLRTPTRSQVTVSERIDVVIDNPREVPLLATVVERDHDEDAQEGCDVTPGTTTRVTCELAASRQYALTIFVPTHEEDRYAGAATLFVNSR